LDLYYERAEHFGMSNCSFLYFADPGQLVIYPASIRTMRRYFQDYRKSLNFIFVLYLIIDNFFFKDPHNIQNIFSSTESSFQWKFPRGNFVVIKPVKWRPRILKFNAGEYIIFRQDIIHAGNSN
jgi:hypothetical protein